MRPFANPSAYHQQTVADHMAAKCAAEGHFGAVSGDRIYRTIMPPDQLGPKKRRMRAREVWGNSNEVNHGK